MVWNSILIILCTTSLITAHTDTHTSVISRGSIDYQKASLTHAPNIILDGAHDMRNSIQ